MISPAINTKADTNVGYYVSAYDAYNTAVSSMLLIRLLKMATATMLAVFILAAIPKIALADTSKRILLAILLLPMMYGIYQLIKSIHQRIELYEYYTNSDAFKIMQIENYNPSCKLSDILGIKVDYNLIPTGELTNYKGDRVTIHYILLGKICIVHGITVQ